MSVTLRFVTCKDPASAVIRWAEDFWASHVEAVFSDGYLGAHADGGVQVRPVGYDKAILIRDEIVTLQATPDASARFEAYLRKRLKQPYDWPAIFGFALHADMHAKEHAICSALQASALYDSAIAGPFPMPTYQISPRDLRLWCSGRP